VGPETLVGCIEYLIGRYPQSFRVRDGLGRLPVHAIIDNMAGWCRYPNRHVDATAIQNYAASILPRLATTVTATAGRPNKLNAILCIVRQWPESRHERSGVGLLPLQLALRSGVSAKIVQFFLDRLPEACPDGTRSGMLHYAIGFAWQNVELVAKAIPESVFAMDLHGMLPVHVAVARDNPNLARVLAEACPGSLLVKNGEGDLALHMACSGCLFCGSRESDAVKLLVEHCSESLRMPGKGGKLPLHAAVSKVDPSLELLRLVVDPWPRRAPAFADDEGNVPLLLASSNPTASLDVAYYLLTTCPEVVGGRKKVGRCS
jgi:hypothetical protein